MLYVPNKCLVIKIYISAGAMPVSAVSRVASPVHPTLGRRERREIKQSLSLITAQRMTCA